MSPLSQSAEAPEGGHHHRRADSGHKGIATLFQHIDPIAIIHDGQQEQRHRDERHRNPMVRQPEGTLSQPHQQQPPASEDRHTQPRIVEELRQISASPNQQAPRDQHFLLEEHLGMQEEILLLYHPELITLEHEQRYGSSHQSHQPYRQESIDSSIVHNCLQR